MKQFYKWIATVLGVLFSMFSIVGCATKSSAKISFAWKETPPQEVTVGDELIFKDYLSEEEGATYTLYVSYENPVTEENITNEKQSSLIYTLDYATVYTFKIERVLNGKTASLEATVEALPKAPAFTRPTQVSASVGETKSFEEIFTLSGIFVTPSDLTGKVKFKEVKIEKATYSATTEDSGLLETKTIADTESQFTFQYGAIYTFLVTAENKSGSANVNIVVSTVDESKMTTKTEISYDFRQKVVSWTAIEEATAYRVQFGNTKLNVTETTYSMANVEDGEYEVSIAPIYGDEIYTQSFASKLISVGMLKTALRLSCSNYTITWPERSFATSYKVTENGSETILSATELSYTLKGKYVTHEEVTVSVVAEMEDEGETASSVPATVTINYGTVFLKAIDATASANAYKEVSGIEFVEVSAGLTGNTWVMAEFKGKNAPNFAVRAVQGFSELTYDKSNPYWSNAGMMLMNSLVGEKTDKLYITRGFFACNSMNGAIDVRGYISPVIGNENAPGLRYLHDESEYIMLIGYEHDLIGYENGSENLCKITAIYFEVNSDGSLTKVFEDTTIATSAWKYLPGDKVIAYPNISSEENSEGVTFTYYPAAETLAEIINNSTSKNKANLKALLGV